MIGKVIGDYRILEKRGEGGMGMFFKAQDIRLDRFVGIKTIRAELLHEPGVVAKLEEEAKSLARLDHPNIARLLHYMVINEQRYIVMEYVEGLDLAERLRREGPLPLDLMAKIVPQVCAAIGYAHNRNVIHRDIKPSNILMTADGTVKVTDFGIAKILGVSTKTKTGVATGSLPYMAPEQIRGSGIDARTDIYQLGVMFFELLVGRRPFLAETEYDMMSHHLSTPPPIPSSLNAKVPATLDAVVLKALAKSPADRFGTTVELNSAFSVACGADDASKTVYRPGSIQNEPQVKPPTSRRGLARLLGGVAIGILALTAFFKVFVLDRGNDADTVTVRDNAAEFATMSIRARLPDTVDVKESWKRRLRIEYLTPGLYNVFFGNGARGTTDGAGGSALGTEAPGSTSPLVEFSGDFQVSDSVRFTVMVTDGDSLVLYEGSRVAPVMAGAVRPTVEIELRPSKQRLRTQPPAPEPKYVNVLLSTDGLNVEARQRAHHWHFEVEQLGAQRGHIGPIDYREFQRRSSGKAEWAPLSNSNELYDTVRIEPSDSVAFRLKGYDELGQVRALYSTVSRVGADADFTRISIRVPDQSAPNQTSRSNLTLDIQPFSERERIEAVWVNGRRHTGPFPLELSVAPKLQVVRWQIGNDYWTDTVTVGSEVVHKDLMFEMSRGRINITATFPDGPGYAEIVLDGQDTGQGTPGELRNVATGPHEITLRRDGYKMQGGPFIVRVPANDRARVSISMVPTAAPN